MFNDLERLRLSDSVKQKILRPKSAISGLLYPELFQTEAVLLTVPESLWIFGARESDQVFPRSSLNIRLDPPHRRCSILPARTNRESFVSAVPAQAISDAVSFLVGFHLTALLTALTQLQSPSHAVRLVCRSFSECRRKTGHSLRKRQPGS